MDTIFTCFKKMFCYRLSYPFTQSELQRPDQGSLFVAYFNNHLFFNNLLPNWYYSYFFQKFSLLTFICFTTHCMLHAMNVYVQFYLFRGGWHHRWGFLPGCYTQKSPTPRDYKILLETLRFLCYCPLDFSEMHIRQLHTFASLNTQDYP